MMQSSSSASTIFANDDLLALLLAPLPVKSLIRLKLVCRQWCSVISSPHFVCLHHLHRRKPHEPFFLLRSLSVSDRFFIFRPSVQRLIPFRFMFPDVEVMQSCNGLLLLSRGPRLPGRKDYYVFNPTTRQYRNLNLPKVFLGLCLVFDPLKSPHYRVFGFRSSNRHNRVLSVYDSETDTWKDKVEFGLQFGKFCQGFYWNDGLYHIQPGCRYRRFSLEERKTYELPKVPKIRYLGRRKCYAVESNGHMHFVSLCLNPDNNWLYVYELSRGDHSWFRIHRGDLNPISATFAADQGRAISVLGLVREERFEDSTLLIHVPGRIMRYRFYTETFEELVDLTRETYFEEGRLQFECEVNNAHQFIDSLAPV